MMEKTPWSIGGPGNDAAGALANFQDSVPVQLIATRRSDFKTCRSDESPFAVVERNHADSFDYLPVVGSDAGDAGTILGVFRVATCTAAVTSVQSVRDLMQPLSEKHLIGADASILTFIDDADRHPFRFVVAGRKISGLVTISDMQRLPVRAALFAMVTHLEMMMADVVRHRYSEPEAWMDLLPLGRRAMIDDELQSARDADTFVDQLLYTQFCDKVTILRKGWRPSKDGALTKAGFKKDLRDIEDLRNDLAHANNYAATKVAAERVCETVRRIELWVGAMAEWRVRGTEGTPPMLSEGD